MAKSSILTSIDVRLQYQHVHSAAILTRVRVTSKDDHEINTGQIIRSTDFCCFNAGKFAVVWCPRRVG